jgi:hypothetical protein
MNDNEVHVRHTWAELLEWRKDFPAIVHRWLKIIDRLIVYTKIQDDDELGDLIVGFMVSSRMDVTDLMTLAHAWITILLTSFVRANRDAQVS